MRKPVDHEVLVRLPTREAVYVVTEIRYQPFGQKTGD
jgi:hypothetical protein